MMTLRVGDLVQYRQGPERLAIVLMTHTTNTGAKVCEVVLVHDTKQPDSVGQKRYSNQEYWKKVEVSGRPLDEAIAGQETEYEDTIDLHKVYGES